MVGTVELALTQRVFHNGVILWKVELVFVGSISTTIMVPSNKSLLSALEAAMVDTSLRIRIGASHVARLELLKFVILDETQNQNKVYIDLNPTIEFNSMLESLRVIEYPTIYAHSPHV
ncbi:hypothetical protein P9112_002913 [Eukaryota sp. TZLM1-RC]